MIRSIFMGVNKPVLSILLLMLISTYCDAQKPRDKNKVTSERTIEGLDKFPIEARFASNFYRSNKAVVDLADSLIFEMMRSDIQIPFTVLSKEPKTHRFFNGLVSLRLQAMTGVKDLKLKAQITTKFSQIIVSEAFDDWLVKLFRDKSRIEVVAKLREIQTACLQIEDLVFEDLALRIRKE